MANNLVNAGIIITVVGVVVWGFYGVKYAAVSMAKSGGFISPSAYGPSPSSYGMSGPLLIVGIIITAVGIAVGAAGLRRSKKTGTAQ